MSISSHPDHNKLVESKKDLVAWFEHGCVPAERLLIGVEHEKPPFYLDDHGAVPFAGAQGRSGVQDFIQKMQDEKGWQPAETENGLVISLQKGQTHWTFEPGLQMETSGAPYHDVHQIARETDRTIREAVEVSRELGFGMLATGFHPVLKGEAMPVMPLSRYEAIRQHVKDNHFSGGLDLMSCTAAAQVNMGYQSEADMVKMLRVSLSLQPVVVALFANSPFSEGKTTGYQSIRSHKIYNNFGGRYGYMLPIAFRDGFGFDMFADYAMNAVLMMGIYKSHSFVDTHGGKFADFMKGDLAASPGRRATLRDWENHLNTIWPEVRLRHFLEMRGADNGPAEMIKALPAFWTGLLYDKTALDAAYEMVKDWTQQDRDYLRVMTPNTGLQTPFLGTTVQDLARNCLALAESGLKRRRVLNQKGQDESVYLEPLHEIAASGLNWAQRLEDRYRNVWKGDINPLFTEMNYENEPSVLKSAPVFKPGDVRRDKGLGL